MPDMAYIVHDLEDLSQGYYVFWPNEDDPKKQNRKQFTGDYAMDRAIKFRDSINNPS